MIKNFLTQTPSWLSRLAPLLSVSCFLEHRGPKVSSKGLLQHRISPSALALGSCCLWAISLSLTAHRLCFPDHDNRIQELCLYKSQLIRYALSVLWKCQVHSLTMFTVMPGGTASSHMQDCLSVVWRAFAESTKFIPNRGVWPPVRLTGPAVFTVFSCLPSGKDHAGLPSARFIWQRSAGSEHRGRQKAFSFWYWDEHERRYISENRSFTRK